MRFLLCLPILSFACYSGTAAPTEGWSIEVVAEGIDMVDGLALTSDGYIIAARETAGGGVVRVDPATGTFEIFAPDLDRPDNVLVDGTGAVFVSQEIDDGRVVRIAAGRSETFAGGLRKPEGIDMDEDGFLYVAEHDADGRILRIAPDGQMEELGRTVDGEGLRVLADRSIIVAETSKDRLLRLFPDGTRAYLFEGQLNLPDGVGYDRTSGRLFVTEDAAPGSVYEVDLEAGRLTEIAFDLNAPQTMVFEADGAMLLAEQKAGRILRLRELAN
jgi:sugar lactone lactonase YvrE